MAVVETGSLRYFLRSASGNVAEVSNLLCRGFPIRSRSNRLEWSGCTWMVELWAWEPDLRIPVTAGWKPAIQQTGSLRYFLRSALGIVARVSNLLYRGFPVSVLF